MDASQLEFANDIVTFLNESCTAFHAVEASKSRLLSAGFVQLSEGEEWNLVRNGKYFFTRNTTTLLAFTVGGAYVAGNGYTVCGAHTDRYSLISCSILFKISLLLSASFTFICPPSLQPLFAHQACDHYSEERCPCVEHSALRRRSVAYLVRQRPGCGRQSVASISRRRHLLSPGAHQRPYRPHPQPSHPPDRGSRARALLSQPARACQSYHHHEP